MFEAFEGVEDRHILNGPRPAFSSKLTLIHFFSLTSDECTGTTGMIEKLHEAISNYALEVVGVLTPQFSLERDETTVRFWLEKLKIRFTVILDHDYYAWSYFNNQGWGTTYVLDQSGDLVFEAEGAEGLRGLPDFIGRLTGASLEELEEFSSHETSHDFSQVYFGTLRGNIPNSRSSGPGPSFLSLPAEMEPEAAYPVGHWEITKECIRSLDDTCSLTGIFSARSMHLTAGAAGKKEISVCVDKLCNTVSLPMPGLYSILENSVTDQKLLEIKCPEGVSIYSLSTGS